MSLIRTTIVVAVVVALLPSDGEQQERMLKRVAAAATWTYTFCDRNVTICEKAGLVWTEFTKKAQFAAQVAYDIAERSVVEQEEARMAPASYTAPAYYAPSKSVPPLQAVAPPQGTLNRHDMEPAWRGNTPRGGI